uniref:CRAL-TRIO domain-containing protein n=1 Tax=Stomoxys calcitrans TaxID=35570 RepID=A0A1I8NNA7_STOCA
MAGELDGAQKVILLNYKLRNKYDHIFLKRDPLAEVSQNALKTIDILPLPGRTPENYKMVLYRIEDADPEKFKFTECITALFMVMDCSLAADSDDICDGEIIIYDMAGYTLKHLARTNISTLRVFMKYTQEARAGRVRQIHILNAASYLDKVLSFVKPFMNSEIAKVLHAHLNGSDTPYEFFPRELLPEEYGGNNGKISNIRQHWWAKLKEMRGYLMDESRWKLNNPNPEITESIKNLEID